MKRLVAVTVAVVLAVTACQPPKTRAPKTGSKPTVTTVRYDRSDENQWGTPWQDIDGNGCNQRTDVLARDLQPGYHRDPKTCAIREGTLIDPYTGITVTGLTRDLDIDHVVPLAEAWRSGADAWPTAKRIRFANDFDHLRATTAKQNRAKGDRGPADWLPSRDACGYVHRYIAIKTEYELAIDPREQRVLANCP